MKPQEHRKCPVLSPLLLNENPKLRNSNRGVLISQRIRTVEAHQRQTQCLKSDMIDGMKRAHFLEEVHKDKFPHSTTSPPPDPPKQE